MSSRLWRDGAPLLHDDLFTAGADSKPEKTVNIAKQVTFSKGDAAAGFRQADVVVERRYTTKTGAPGLYRAARLCRLDDARRQVQIWASSQGQFMIRAYCAKLLDIDMANIRVTPAEIGGGFGGKTLNLFGAGGIGAISQDRAAGQDRDDA